MSSIKPILFNTEMTIAVEKNRKTQTRRLVRFPSGRIEGKIPDPDRIHLEHVSGEHAFFRIEPFYRARIKSPYKVGDILYVRETWGDYRECQDDGEGHYYLYRAVYPNGATTYQYPGGPVCDLPKWHPSIHMPKEAARIFLRVTDVRVERLQEITDEGAKAEGANNRIGVSDKMRETAIQRFQRIWDRTIKPADLSIYGWAANPWVWVYSFERCEKPEEWK